MVSGSKEITLPDTTENRDICFDNTLWKKKIDIAQALANTLFVDVGIENELLQTAYQRKWPVMRAAS